MDEYQDSNLVQEMITGYVSGWVKDRKNIFMVGDVKQSIYRFRLARPELFMEKYHKFSEDDGPEVRINLAQKISEAAPKCFERKLYLPQAHGRGFWRNFLRDDEALYPEPSSPKGIVRIL